MRQFISTWQTEYNAIIARTDAEIAERERDEELRAKQSEMFNLIYGDRRKSDRAIVQQQLKKGTDAALSGAFTFLFYVTLVWVAFDRLDHWIGG